MQKLSVTADGESCTDTLSQICTQTLWEPLTGPLQRLKAVISSLEALALWCWLRESIMPNIWLGNLGLSDRGSTCAITHSKQNREIAFVYM